MGRGRLDSWAVSPRPSRAPSLAVVFLRSSSCAPRLALLFLRFSSCASLFGSWGGTPLRAAALELAFVGLAANQWWSIWRLAYSKIEKNKIFFATRPSIFEASVAYWVIIIAWRKLRPQLTQDVRSKFYFFLDFFSSALR